MRARKAYRTDLCARLCVHTPRNSILLALKSIVVVVIVVVMAVALIAVVTIARGAGVGEDAGTAMDLKK